MTGNLDAVPRYGVVGNPVAHSLSPQIHAAFAAQTGMPIDYRRVLAPLDAFADTLEHFAAAGGRGLNVTVPFKLAAYLACARLSERARRAGAVNWLTREDDGWVGDNTDGSGLVRDLERIVRGSTHRLDGRLLVVGAGGAARGILGPLLAHGPARCVVVNRTIARAESLLDAFPDGAIAAADFETLGDEAFDLVVNATSASLDDVPLPLSHAVFADGALAYDLMYGARPTRFMRDARAAGAATVVDGLGMLVEQAAESFHLWRGAQPQTEPVLATLRAQLATASS
jgi:shikimate dehydrogenase